MKKKRLYDVGRHADNWDYICNVAKRLDIDMFGLDKFLVDNIKSIEYIGRRHGISRFYLATIIHI